MAGPNIARAKFETVFLPKCRYVWSRLKLKGLGLLLLLSLTLSVMLALGYFRYAINITDPVFVSTTHTIPESINLPDSIFSIKNVYSWQTIFPKFLSLPFLDYADLCLKNKNTSYYQNKPILDNEIGQNLRDKNAAMKVTLTYKDNSSIDFEVRNGEGECRQVNLSNLLGGRINLLFNFLRRSDGEGDIEIRTKDSRLYIWPGYVNLVFLFLVSFLFLSSVWLYLSGIKKLIWRS